MELPPNNINNTPVQNNSQANRFKFSIKNLSLAQKIAFFGASFIVILVLLILVLVVFQTKQNNENQIPNSDPDKELQEAKKQTAEKKINEASASVPINQLQAAYQDVIGSNSVKRNLGINSKGVANIEYTIPSVDGQTVIKVSYENFADLAAKIFNIPTVTRLNVTTYATKFTDQFGQPDQAAIKMQVSKETSAKINWPLKKFAYKDYATILDLHEINSLLQKDYETLTKTKSN